VPDEHYTHLGVLVDIASGCFTARLDADARHTVYRRVGDEQVTIGQVGTYVLAAGQQTRILCQIASAREEKDGDTVEHLLTLLPLGAIGGDGSFSRGIGRFPPLGTPVYLAERPLLDAMFASVRRHGLDLGRLSQRSDLPVYADPSLLFNRHLAILGQSGAGKSWAVCSILQRAVKLMPRAHIVLLDLHGEYGWRGADGTLHSAFPADVVRYIDARALEIPYWLLTYGELIDLLVDRNDANAALHISFLREVLHALRREDNDHLGIDRLSVDSPVYFSLDDLYESCREVNEQQFEFGKSDGPLFGAFTEFLLRFQAMRNDSRYDFLLRPERRTASLHLEDLLRDFIGLGEPKRQITVIDLSAVPSDVRPTVTAQIGRLAFEFNYWNPRRREFPILLVCEEAHQYIPNDRHDNRQAATTRQMERIAREGRKYGIGLCVVSQRPTEVSETVLSQCGNFICLRTTNPGDQDYIRRLMPQGEQGLAELLATLRRGEALALGDAVALPTRFRIYPPDPAPARSDVDVARAWRTGPEDLDVADIVRRWWRQAR